VLTYIRKVDRRRGNLAHGPGGGHHGIHGQHPERHASVVVPSQDLERKLDDLDRKVRARRGARPPATRVSHSVLCPR
jgi:hypothetical protein